MPAHKKKHACTYCAYSSYRNSRRKSAPWNVQLRLVSIGNVWKLGFRLCALYLLFSFSALLLFITLIPSRQNTDLSPSCFHSLPLLCPLLRASSSSSSNLSDATTGAVLATNVACQRHPTCPLYVKDCRPVLTPDVSRG